MFSDRNESNKETKKLPVWCDPFLWVFIVIAAASVVISTIKSGGWLSDLFLISVIITSVLIFLLTRHKTASVVEPGHPVLESWVMLAYFGLYFVLSMLTRGEGILSNEFLKWLWFIILPILVIYFLNWPNRDFKNLLKSVGFRRQGLGKSLLFGLLAYVIFIPFMPFMMPAAQQEKLLEIFQEPLRLIVFLPLCFLLSLVTAASTEEIFFRGILQSRFSRLMKSELRSCLVIAFLFGIYHLPYAYYSIYWASHWDILWAVTGVLSEQMITGVVLGILWWRTHNIAGPMLFHALVNLAGVMTSINFGTG